MSSRLPETCSPGFWARIVKHAPVSSKFQSLSPPSATEKPAPTLYAVPAFASDGTAKSAVNTTGSDFVVHHSKSLFAST